MHIASAIVAVSENGVIGRDNELPWYLPRDMKFFRETTTGHSVIMGRKNWDSIPAKFRPLVGRTNIVLTRSTLTLEGAVTAPSLETALGIAEENPGAEEVFIIGGGEVYVEALPFCERVYLTRVHAEIEGNVHFPELDLQEWRLVRRQWHNADAKHLYSFTWEVYERQGR